MTSKSVVNVETGPNNIPVLLLLCFCVVLSMTTWFSATAVMPQLQAYWNVTPQQGAWLAISVQLGFAIGAVGSAAISLSDVVPARYLMAASAAAVAVANLGPLFVHDANTGIVLRIIVGVLLAGIYAPALKLISTWFYKGRGVALGSVIGALTLGSAMPYAINAVGGLDWRIVIVTTSVASLVAAVLMVTWLRDGPYPFAKTTFNPWQIKETLTNRVFLLSTIGYLGHMWELYAMWTWLLFFVKAKLAASGIDSNSMASLLTFLIIAVGAPACIFAGAAADRIGRTAMTFILLAFSGTCAGVIGLTFDVPIWLFLIVGLIWGATVVADSAQFSTIVTEAGNPKLVGTALTIQLGLGFALTVPAVWLLPMAEHWLGSWQWVFLILVPGPVIGAVAMAMLRRLPEATLIAHGRR